MKSEKHLERSQTTHEFSQRSVVTHVQVTTSISSILVFSKSVTASTRHQTCTLQLHADLMTDPMQRVCFVNVIETKFPLSVSFHVVVIVKVYLVETCQNQLSRKHRSSRRRHWEERLHSKKSLRNNRLRSATFVTFGGKSLSSIERTQSGEVIDPIESTEELLSDQETRRTDLQATYTLQIASDLTSQSRR